MQPDRTEIPPFVARRIGVRGFVVSGWGFLVAIWTFWWAMAYLLYLGGEFTGDSHSETLITALLDESDTRAIFNAMVCGSLVHVLLVLLMGNVGGGTLVAQPRSAPLRSALLLAMVCFVSGIGLVLLKNLFHYGVLWREGNWTRDVGENVLAGLVVLALPGGLAGLLGGVWMRNRLRRLQAVPTAGMEQVPAPNPAERLRLAGLHGAGAMIVIQLAWSAVQLGVVLGITYLFGGGLQQQRALTVFLAGDGVAAVLLCAAVGMSVGRLTAARDWPFPLLFCIGFFLVSLVAPLPGVCSVSLWLDGTLFFDGSDFYENFTLPYLVYCGITAIPALVLGLLAGVWTRQRMRRLAEQDARERFGY